DWGAVPRVRGPAGQGEQAGWTCAGHRRWAGGGTQLGTATATAPDGSETEQVPAQRGHAAVATLLEAAAEEWVPVERLGRRALAHRDLDEDAETWWTVADVLAARGDDETYEALTRLCGSADAREREFGV